MTSYTLALGLRQTPKNRAFRNQPTKVTREPNGGRQTGQFAGRYGQPVEAQFLREPDHDRRRVIVADRELDKTLGLTAMGAEGLQDSRLGRNKQHGLLALLRQTIYSGLVGYEDVDDVERLALPQDVMHWSLTTLREKLVKIGAKVTRHTKHMTFQLA